MKTKLLIQAVSKFGMGLIMVGLSVAAFEALAK